MRCNGPTSPTWLTPEDEAFGKLEHKGHDRSQSLESSRPELDDEFGLINMNARLYDPEIGRFISPDPILAEPGWSQGLNPYSYVRNNPLTWVDPSGHEAITAAAVAGVVAVVIVIGALAYGFADNGEVDFDDVVFFTTLASLAWAEMTKQGLRRQYNEVLDHRARWTRFAASSSARQRPGAAMPRSVRRQSRNATSGSNHAACPREHGANGGSGRHSVDGP